MHGITFTCLLLALTLGSTSATLSTNPDDVGFYLYPNSADPSDADKLIFGDLASVESSRFDPSKKVIVFSSGFRQNYTSDQWTKNAYLLAGFAAHTNVIVVDWGALSGNQAPQVDIPTIEALAILPLYLDAVSNVKIVGKRVQEFLSFLRNNGKLSQEVHLVGASLGAHVMGNAGMNYRAEHGEPITRITGIDPAGPIFQLLPVKSRLDATDAAFVDVLHTNQGVMGYFGSLGHVDHYANGAAPIQIQPQCKDNLANIFCSHYASTLYFVKSIVRENLIAKSCNDALPLAYEICKRFGIEEEINFGQSTPSTARGTFYINNLTPSLSD